MSRSSARPARAALVVALLLLPARHAAAQLGSFADPRVFFSAQTQTLQTDAGAYDYEDKGGYTAGGAVTDQDGNRAGGYVNTETFTVRSFAHGSPSVPTWTTGWAKSQAFFSTDIRFFSGNLGSTSQPFDAFFHGLLQRTSGTRGGYGYADMWFRVRDSDGVVIMQMAQSQSATSKTASTGPVTVAQPLRKSIDIGMGYSRFFIELGVITEVQGSFEAEFGNTVNLFIPTVAGVTWEAAPGVGSQQYVPRWAGADAPTTTTPEPASLALVGAGALALVAVRRGRRAA